MLRPICWFRGHDIKVKPPTITVAINPPTEEHRLDWRCSRCGKHGFERYVVSEFGGLFDAQGSL